MKNFLIAAIALGMTFLMVIPVDAGTTTLGGLVGFNRSFLRINGEIMNLGDASPGLTFLVPFDATEDANGKLIDDGTHGMNFTTSLFTDEGLMYTSLRMEYWRDYGPVKVMLGPTLDFFDASDIVPEQTNCVGACGALRFRAQGLPAQLSGSWSQSYSGIESVSVSNIMLGLVGSFD